jgi:hypothetical protein
MRVKNKHSNRTTVKPVITLGQSCSKFSLMQAKLAELGLHASNIQFTTQKEERMSIYVYKIIHIISLPFFLHICNNKCRDKKTRTFNKTFNSQPRLGMST